MSFPKYKYQEEPEHSAHPINIYLNIWTSLSLTQPALNLPPECRYEVNLS